MPSAQRGPARSNMAVGAGGYIKRAKANSVFSCASGGQRKIVVFDGRIFAERTLESEQRSDAAAKATLATSQPCVRSSTIEQRAASFSRT